MAWLQQRTDPKDSNSASRAEVRLRKGQPLNLPPVEAQHLLADLNALGWCASTGMGAAPLPAAELLAWAAGTGSCWQPWEFRALRAASAAYCAAFACPPLAEPAAPAPDAPPPRGSLFKALADALNKPRQTPAAPPEAAP